MRNWFIIFLLFGGVPNANANENLLQSAEQASWEGDYDQAILLLSEYDNYQSSELEAETRLVRYSLGLSDDPKKELDLAKIAALRALDFKPDAVQPRYSLIAIIGYQARTKRLFTLIRKKWVSKGRKLIDETLILAPDNPWSHAMLGNWNLEIILRTSKRRARIVGASIKSAFDGCAKALELAPTNTHITAQCGFALLAVNDQALQQLALKSLELAAKPVPANDAFTCLRQQQAAKILQSLKENDEKTARKLAKRALSVNKVTDWPRQCEQSNQFANAPVSAPDIQD